MHFDATLKELFQQAPPRLLELLTGTSVAELLTVEYPAVRTRRPDLVVRLATGRVYHLEIQAQVDPEMPWRMLEYYMLLHRQFGQPPAQQVLMIGPETKGSPAGILQGNLQFRYDLVQLENVPGEDLLASSSLADNLLGLLCRIGDLRAALAQTLERVGRLTAKKQADVMAQLLILSKLRPRLQLLIREEYGQMPIPIPEDLFDDPIFAPTISKRDERNRRLGEETFLRRMIVQRFGELPEWAESRLTNASSDELKRWSLRLLEAHTLTEIFQD